MSVLVAFSVTPIGAGEDVGELVSEAVRVVRASGLPNRTDAMFTTVEGESWDEVMAVVKDAVAAVEARAGRVSLVLKADIREGSGAAWRPRSPPSSGTSPRDALRFRERATRAGHPPAPVPRRPVTSFAAGRRACGVSSASRGVSCPEGVFRPRVFSWSG